MLSEEGRIFTSKLLYLSSILRGRDIRASHRNVGNLTAFCVVMKVRDSDSLHAYLESSASIL